MACFVFAGKKSTFLSGIIRFPCCDCIAKNEIHQRIDDAGKGVLLVLAKILYFFREIPRTEPTRDLHASSPEELWGWLPIQSVVVALGVLLVAVACSASRADLSWAQPVFWAGYLTIICLPVVRLTMRGVSRQERIGTVVMVGLAFYLIKICYSPLVFNFNDEMQHWRSTYDTLRVQHLFEYNPTLPASSYFPGLESVANAFIAFTSTSIFNSGIVIEGVVRILTILSLFLLFERVTKSGYATSLGCLVYFSDPNFMLGDSQFTYEGIAIALSVTGLYFALQRVQLNESRGRLGLILVAILCFSAAIVTHHVTSYILAMLVSIWGIVPLLGWKFPEWKFGPSWFAALIVSGCVAWLALVGPIVIPYIGLPVRNGFAQAVQVVMGAQKARTFFAGGSSNQVPLILQLGSYAYVVVVAGLLPFGALRIWQRKSENSLAPAMVVMGMLFYVAQLLRLSPDGLALTNRLAGAIYLPLSLVAGVGAAGYVNRRFLGKFWRVAIVAALVVVNFGSAAAIVTARALPGPYNVDIFSRRINTEGFQTAAWAADVLGPDHRFGADAINMLILGSYGQQHLVTEISDDLFIEQSIYQSSQFGMQEMMLLHLSQVDYMTVDSRIDENKQVIGPLKPGSPAFLTNLDGLPTIDRILDGGHIMVYRLGFVGMPLPPIETPTPTP